MDTLNGVVAQFNVASSHYAAAIQPFALKLFIGLLFLDILVTALQFGLDQGDAAHYLGRLFKHVLSGGFIYLMIINAFPWMGYVLQSFSRVGTSVSGMPHLDPGTVLQVGGNMAQTIFDSPASASLMPNIELAIVESVSAFIVLLSFVIAAAALTLTLIESYLVIGGAVLLLGFGGSRWTASIAEGYFSYVIRVGTRLLFFYLVLGIGIQIATQWQAAILAACHPVSTALPWFTTYGVPPKSIMTTVCSNVVPVHAMLNLTAMSIVFLIITLAVPYTAASIVSGTVGLALSHAFEAAYVAQTIVRPITSALQTGFNKVARGASSAMETNAEPSAWLRPIDLSQHARRTANLTPDAAPRVPAPRDAHSTSLMAPGSRATSVLKPDTTRMAQGNTTKPAARPTSTV